MGLLIANELAATYSWLGRREKLSFKNFTLTNLVIGNVIFLKCLFMDLRFVYRGSIKGKTVREKRGRSSYLELVETSTGSNKENQKLKYRI